MAATVNIIERNGSTGTATTKTSGTIRFKNADNAVVNTSNPMVIPAAGDDFSYEKWVVLRIGATPPSDVINNVKVYTDGANGFGTGIDVFARSASAFSTPSEPTTTTGLTSIWGYTAGGALALSSTNYSGSGTYVGSHVVMTMRVQSTATVGALAAETITFIYDEI